MNIYGSFARVYDRFMEDTPYDDWARYIDSILRREIKAQDVPLGGQREKPLVLDLACGTGSLTVRLAEMGYDLIGVDASADMLSEAWDKSAQKGLEILFLQQDMRELELFGTVDAAVSACDGLNYILNEAELSEVFKRVVLFLNPGGVFIFDLNQEYKFKNCFDGNTFSASSQGASYVWKNRYDAETRTHEYDVAFLVQSGHDEPLYFEEKHHERAYSSQTVVKLLTAAGFERVGVYDAYTQNPPAPQSERLSFVAVKCYNIPNNR